MFSNSYVVAHKYTGVIVYCVLGGLTIIGVVIISVVRLLKKPFRAITPENEPMDNAMIPTIGPVTMTSLPETNHMDIFEMDLPPSDTKAKSTTTTEWQPLTRRESKQFYTQVC